MRVKAGLEGTELLRTPCLITVGETTVLPVAKVDLLTLNPALTSHGIHLTGTKNKQLGNQVRVTKQETLANGLKPLTVHDALSF